MSEAAKRRLRTSRFALSVYWLTIFVGTHMPLTLEIEASQLDKLAHFGAFAGLAFFLAYYRGQLESMTRSAYFAIFAIAAVYGAFDEFTQRFVPGRTGDPLDWLADVVGAAAGLGAYWLYDQRRSKIDIA